MRKERYQMSKVFWKKATDLGKLAQIREVTFQLYPCGYGENNDTSWRSCCKAINESCRRLNKTKEKLRKENIPLTD